MATSCLPITVDLTTHAFPLGVQDGFTAHIGGIAVDEAFVYATHYLHDSHNPGTPRGVGHLTIIERSKFRDPNVVPMRVPVGFDPRSIAVNPTNGIVYVVNRGTSEGQHSLSLVRRDGRTGQWTHQTQLQLPFGVADVAVNVVRNRIYVSNWSHRRIHVFDGNTHAELPSITDPTDEINPFRPLGMAVDSATNTIYVALSFGPQPRVDALGVIALTDDAVQTIRRVQLKPARTQPHDVAYNPVTKRVYVAGLGAAGAAGPSVTVVDAEDLAILARIPTVAGVPATGFTSLAVNTELNEIYVAVAGSIQVIDGATNEISVPNEVTLTLGSLALDPTTGQLFTGDHSDGMLRRLTLVVTDSPIGRYWQTNPELGAPLTAQQTTPDGRGLFQSFANGAVFYSSDYGTVKISNNLFGSWSGLVRNSRQPARASAADLGNLLQDGIKVGSSDEYAYFERGMVRTTTVAGTATTVTVLGAIYAYYHGRSDINSSLKEPLANEEDAPNGGRRQRFANGDVYWHPNTGAYEVQGMFAERLEALGGVGGIGYPTAERQHVIVNGSGLGFVQSFENGTLTLGNVLGPTLIAGDIRRAWIEKHGGPTGHLGFPVSDELGSPHDPASPVRFVNFDRGVLVWFPEGHEFAGPKKHFNTRAFTSMEVFIKQYISDQDHDASGNADLYVNKRVRASNGVESVQRMPEDGDYGTNDVIVNEHIHITDVVQGDLTISVGFTGRDADSPFNIPPDGDDTLGVIENRYSVDNVWGATENGVHSASDDGTFTVLYSLKPVDVDFDPDKPFRAQWWWRFDNFTTERLDTKQYADTFADVDPGGPGLSFDPLEYFDEGWEALFYHFVYKGIASEGNCFGMSLEALHAMYGNSLSAQPVFQYPRDDLRTNVINIRQGYQVGIDIIQWFIEQLGRNLTQNPVAVWERSRDAYIRGQHPIISFAKFFGGQGHSVLPVPDGWKEEGDRLLISVADPREPFKEGQTDDSFQVRINKQANQFFFTSDDVEYEGGMVLSDVFGDRMFYQPWNVMNGVPTTPGPTLGRLFGSLFILGGAGRVNQISDDQGRTFYKDGLQGPPSKWEDLRYDEGRIKGMTRIPIMAVNSPVGALPTELYAIEGNRTLRYDVTGTPGTSYRWAVRTSAMATVLTVPGSAVPDRITAEELQTARRNVTFALPANATASKRIGLLIEGLPGTARNKQFLLDDLEVQPQQAIQSRIDNAGHELVITNTGPTTTFNLRLRARPGAVPTPQKVVSLTSGKTARLRPADWNDPASASLLVEIRDTPDGPPVKCFEL